MTKAKIRWILRRFPNIQAMIESGQTETFFYINKRTEKIVVDEQVKATVEIMNNLINREPKVWLKELFVKVRRGDKDIAILMDSPVERGKYYQLKERFVSKVFECCIFAGLVTYEEIINEDII